MLPVAVVATACLAGVFSFFAPDNAFDVVHRETETARKLIASYSTHVGDVTQQLIEQVWQLELPSKVRRSPTGKLVASCSRRVGDATHKLLNRIRQFELPVSRRPAPPTRTSPRAVLADLNNAADFEVSPPTPTPAPRATDIVVSPTTDVAVWSPQSTSVQRLPTPSPSTTDLAVRPTTDVAVWYPLPTCVQVPPATPTDLTVWQHLCTRRWFRRSLSRTSSFGRVQCRVLASCRLWRAGSRFMRTPTRCTRHRRE